MSPADRLRALAALAATGVAPSVSALAVDAAEVMKIAQVTADEIIAAAEKQAQRIRADLRSRLKSQLGELSESGAIET